MKVQSVSVLLLINVLLLSLMFVLAQNRTTVEAQQGGSDYLTLLIDLQTQVKSAAPDFGGFTLYLKDDLGNFGKTIPFFPNPKTGNPIITKLASDYMCIENSGVGTRICFKYDLISGVFYQLPHQPDLSISLSGPTTVTLDTAQKGVVYNVNVQNLGSGSSNEFNVGLIEADGKLHDLGTATLKVGQTAHFQTTATFSDVGSYRLTAIADTKSVVEESNQQNNTQVLDVTVSKQ